MGGARVMIALFLQARLTSSRLPRKALLPLEDKTVIEHVMTALRRIDVDTRVLLTDETGAKAFKPFAEACGFDIFTGPEEDVLARFTLAARRYKPDTIVRATGDNPLVSALLAEKIIEIHLRTSADYSGLLGIPVGTGVEVLKTEQLYKAERESSDPYEHEHVSPFIYRRDDRFLVVRPRVSRKYYSPNSRVTLDTRKDYDFLVQIFKALYHGEPIEISELIPWLKQNQQTKTLHQITT